MNRKITEPMACGVELQRKTHPSHRSAAGPLGQTLRPSAMGRRVTLRRSLGHRLTSGGLSVSGGGSSQRGTITRLHTEVTSGCLPWEHPQLTITHRGDFLLFQVEGSHPRHCPSLPGSLALGLKMMVSSFPAQQSSSESSAAGVGNVRPAVHSRPAKSLGLALPRHQGELIKCFATYSRLVFKLIILYGPRTTL